MKPFEKKQEYILELQEDITRNNVDKIERQLLEILGDGDYNSVCLDMSNVNFMDSSGLGMLAKALSFSRKQNRALILCHVNPPVKLVFEISGLDQVLCFSSQVSESPFARLSKSYKQKVAS